MDDFWKIVAVAALTVVASMCGLLVSIIRSLLATLSGETKQNTLELTEYKVRIQFLERAGLEKHRG